MQATANIDPTGTLHSPSRFLKWYDLLLDFAANFWQSRYQEELRETSRQVD